LYDVRVEKDILPDDKGGLEELYDRVKAKGKKRDQVWDKDINITTLIDCDSHIER
jgi:hypothetical protein